MIKLGLNGAVISRRIATKIFTVAPVDGNTRVFGTSMTIKAKT